MKRKTLIEKVLEKGTAVEPRTGKLPNALARLAKIPLITVAHPWFRADKTDMRWLPINENIQAQESAVTPLVLLDRLIEEASHRVVFDACGCRTAFHCENHPLDIGCLMMGDSALEAPRSICHEVSVSEAKEHAARAVEAGLVPMVGKARVDNFIFGIKDRSHLLTCCFCCHCCCISRLERHFRPGLLNRMFPHLDGFRIEVGPGCDGCGDCVERCYMRAIEIKDGVAVISEKCRACGRCASACPPRAIKVSIDNDDFVDLAYQRIREYVKYD